MLGYRRRRYLFPAIMTFIWAYSCYTGRLNMPFHLSPSAQIASKGSIPPEKIVVAAVVCARPGNQHPREEALILIKSAVISCKLYKVPRLEVYLFTEHEKDKQAIANATQHFQFYDKDAVNLSLTFLKPEDAIPKQYQKDLLHDKRFFRCTFVRLFFPTALPNLTSVLYVDSDVIFTGNIAHIWNQLHLMDSEQFIGMTADYEPENPSKSDWTGSIPYPPPKGVQAGILLMNLTRMREYGWEEKVLEIYRGYWKRVALNDQMILNILLYFSPGALMMLPCQYNFRSAHCVRGFYCEAARRDSFGIHLIHGSTSQFSSKKAFYEIFQTYKQIELARPDLDIVTQLMLPIRHVYQEGQSSPNPGHMQCDGNISDLFFKDHFI